jgi:hypothetical protein
MNSKDAASMDQAERLVSNFKDLYQTLNAKNIHAGLIERVYRDDIQFKDSFHSLDGITAFTQYCESIYENVLYSTFNFHEQMISKDQAMLTWTMNYAHPKLNGGNNIAVKGSSHIRYSDKIYMHQDYIDGGELLYEHIPILRWVIKKLKARMA